MSLNQVLVLAMGFRMFEVVDCQAREGVNCENVHLLTVDLECNCEFLGKNIVR